MSEAAIPIYEGQDFYVPYYEVKLQERALAKDVVRDILQVTYKDNIQEIDNFEIPINNWDAQRRRFKYVDERLFDPGKKIELWMGYYGRDRLRLMLKGEITSLRPTFPSGGQPTLSISGLNVLHRLRTKQESHAYEQRTDSEIAQEIGGRLGVTVRTTGTDEERYPYLFQDNQYDIIFLIERARRVGYDLFVEERTADAASETTALYFGPSDAVRTTTYRLSYGRSLVEFQPNLTTANQVGEVTVRGWDNIKKKKIEATVKRSELATRGVGERGGQAAIEQSFNQRQEIVATKPIHSEQEAKTLAKETLERIAKDMVKGTGSTVGLPDLRAGGVIEIDGIGDRFSGKYFLTATTHTIGGSGYTTQFECRREET